MADRPRAFDVEVLLPVHNEAETIEATIREMYNEFSPKVKVQFIICEDGSQDNSKEILRRLSQEIPMNLILSDARKGYLRAIRDGMLVMEAPYLLCLDSDGQCDPKDFWQFWEARTEADILKGWRVNRADTALRRYLSRAFYLIYQLIFHVPVHDPSYAHVLTRKEVIFKLAPELGAMQEGLWWEFVARAHRRGYSIREMPVNHRPRVGGTTRVFKYRKMPGIFLRHVVALFKIWSETAR
jgi:glycosyltransferase involved in cell wall biosynthesis